MNGGCIVLKPEIAYTRLLALVTCWRDRRGGRWGTWSRYRTRKYVTSAWTSTFLSPADTIKFCESGRVRKKNRLADPETAISHICLTATQGGGRQLVFTFIDAYLGAELDTASKQ